MNKRAAQIESEVARILDCINSNSDHYRVLNVKRGASIETIRRSYCLAVDLLHPLNCQDITETNGAMRWKLSQVFLRVVEAFSAISHPGRRAQYDAEINRRPAAPAPLPDTPGRLEPPNARAQENSGRNTGQAGSLAGSNSIKAIEEAVLERVKDRRRSPRLKLCVPVRVISINGNWQEVTRSNDVSRTGIKIHLQHEVEPGDQLRLQLPMPLALRNHSHNHSLYTVSAIVRHIEPAQAGGLMVGMEIDDSK
jgi:DnaJ-class molecular chaperone